jgi:hypothetical protein
MTLRPKDKQHALGIQGNHRRFIAQTIYDKYETIAHIIPLKIFQFSDTIASLTAF